MNRDRPPCKNNVVVSAEMFDGMREIVIYFIILTLRPIFQVGHLPPVNFKDNSMLCGNKIVAPFTRCYIQNWRNFTLITLQYIASYLE